MAYRREDIEAVRAATDLAELVAEVTKVKRSGRSVMAVCPFHQEKTPSMSIDPARGLYHCFGCGKSGDLFRFVQETQGLEFSDAVELLARRSGITLHRDPEAARRRDRRQVLVDATQRAVDFYVERLRKAPDAAGARSYLRGRGYDKEVVTGFGLGYSPAGGEALIRHLRDHRINDDVAVSAGLAVRSRTGRVFDRFRGRIMFPIYDLRGDPVGFGARLLEGDGPKYLNSPETPIYRKSRLLYGLNWAKSDIVRDATAVVVEGYTDVIALRTAGFGGAVATCGTSLGEEHFDLLRRFTERVVLMFDSDAAGQAASLRGFEHSVPGDLDLRVALLEPGRDPADVVAAGEVELVRAAVAGSTPMLQFRLQTELDRFALDEPEARGRAIRATADLVALHPDAVARHEYAVFLARRTGVQLPVVEDAVAEAVRRTAAPAPRRREAPRPAADGRVKAERELLRLMLANHGGLQGIEYGPDLLSDPVHVSAYELLRPALEGLGPGEPPDLGSLLGGGDDELSSMLSSLALERRPLDEPARVVQTLQAEVLEDRIQVLKREVAGLDPDRDPEAYSERFNELIALERRRRELRSNP
ncbi:MAG: DNA primase [Actinobacteria bacterium]|nr:DNA primase [Actinomycetota bacterium]